ARLARVERDLAAGVRRLDVAERGAHRVVLVDAVDVDEARLARRPGMLGDLPQHPAAAVRLAPHELVGDEDGDVERGDVALVALPLEVLRREEGVDVGVRYRDRRHPGAAARAALADGPERGREDVPERRHRPRVVGAAEAGPDREAVEDLDGEAGGAGAGAAGAAYRRTDGAQAREVDEDVAPGEEAHGCAPRRRPDALDGVWNSDRLRGRRRLRLLDEGGDAVARGDHLVAHEVEARARPDGLVVGVSGVYRQEEPADLAGEAALGRDRVEVQAVAAADLGHEGELRREPQHPGVRALGLGAAVLDEAVEDV